MTNSADHKAARLLIECHIAEIRKRMCALDAVIKQLEASGSDTSNQVHLLADMAAALKTVVNF